MSYNGIHIVNQELVSCLFDKLEIRIGRVISVEEEPKAPKKTYRLKIDFGKFGIKISVGRFTHHSQEGRNP